MAVYLTTAMVIIAETFFFSWQKLEPVCSHTFYLADEFFFVITQNVKIPSLFLGVGGSRNLVTSLWLCWHFKKYILYGKGGQLSGANSCVPTEASSSYGNHLSPKTERERETLGIPAGCPLNLFWKVPPGGPTSTSFSYLPEMYLFEEWKAVSTRWQLPFKSIGRHLEMWDAEGTTRDTP